MCKYQTLCKGAIVILIWNGFSALATVYNSDGTSINIQYIHDNLAQDGDTITLPPGTFTWTTGVTVNKGITIQGQTTVSGDHSTWSVTSPPPVSDQTILVDNITSGRKVL
jgi:hypothetical protein